MTFQSALSYDNVHSLVRKSISIHEPAFLLYEELDSILPLWGWWVIFLLGAMCHDPSTLLQQIIYSRQFQLYYSFSNSISNSEVALLMTKEFTPKFPVGLWRSSQSCHVFHCLYSLIVFLVTFLSSIIFPFELFLISMSLPHNGHIVLSRSWCHRFRIGNGSSRQRRRLLQIYCQEYDKIRGQGRRLLDFSWSDSILDLCGCNALGYVC